MYNEEVKSDFIKDYMRNRVVAFTSLTGLFNKTEEHECKLKKEGKKLAVQYGYKPNHYIDVIIDKFNEYQE